jgi:hypothetical protein
MTLRHSGFACPVLLLSFIFGGCDRPTPLAPGIEAATGGQPGPTVNAPSNTSAVAVSWSQINVAWRDNSSNETGFEVHRSTTGPGGAFALVATTAANATSYGNGGLSGSTQYCYEVRAFRTTGGKTTYSAFSSAACATTPLPPMPAAPAAAHAAPNQGQWITVTWTDNSTNETGFRVERAGATSGPWTSVVTTPENVTTFNDVQYFNREQAECYRIFAVNSYGDSPASNVFCTAVPRMPVNLAASLPSDGSVQLTWTDNSSVEDGYQVQRATSGPGTVLATLSANATSYRDPAPAPDNTYWYCVFPTRDGGTGDGACLQVVIAIAPPAAPSGLVVLPATSSSVAGSWTDQSTNEAGFRVQRSTDGGASWVTAVTAGIDTVSVTDQPLAAEQQVCYRVIAFNNRGDSPPSNTACTTPPAGPTNLAIVAVDAITVDLSWTDNSAVEDGFEVWVDDGYGNLYAVAFVGPNTTTLRYQDQYAYSYAVYYVVATKDGGHSDFSIGFSPPAPPGASRVSIRATSPVRPIRPVIRMRGKP